MARRRGAARQSWRLTFGALAAIVLIALAAALLHFRETDNGVRSLDDATAAGVRAGAGPAAASGGFFKRLGDAWNAAGRIAELEQENLQLRQWRDTALALSERLDRYEDLLAMPEEAFGRNADVKGAISARLILDSGGPFKRTLLANAGADHGVQLGFIAINEHGLIGRVVAVGRRSSRVLLLDDFQSRVPVMGLQSRTRAILAGDASDTPEAQFYAAALQAPRLDHQAPAGLLREGELVVTSGDGGLFPRGIVVGTAHLRGNAWRVELSVAKAPIDFVRILPFARFDAIPGEDDPKNRQPPPALGTTPAATALPEPAPPIVTTQPRLSPAARARPSATQTDDDDAAPPPSDPPGVAPPQ